MPLRIFPDVIPRGFGSYTIAPMDESLRTEFEVGARRNRRISLDRHDLIDVTWTLTNEEFELFRAWYADEARSLLGDSEDLIGNGWTASNATVSQQAAAGPDGDQATRIVENTVSNSHYVFKDIPQAQLPDEGRLIVTASIRAAGRDFARLEATNRNGATSGVYVGLSNMTLGAVSGGGIATIQDRGNGWRRVTISAPLAAGATAYTRVRLFAMSAITGSTTYTGNGADGIDVCEVTAKLSNGFDLPAKTNTRGEVMGANGGAEWFRLTVMQGDGFVTRDVRFAAPWRASMLNGRNWSVSAQLEISDNL